jgi:hypothetical protein
MVVSDSRHMCESDQTKICKGNVVRFHEPRVYTYEGDDTPENGCWILTHGRQYLIVDVRQDSWGDGFDYCVVDDNGNKHWASGHCFEVINENV